jgi:solute carrier family 13 (sodium-dependent dicarboxylate transporter), member 2/3/5
MRDKILLSFALVVFFVVLLKTGGKDTFTNALLLGGLMVYLWIFEIIPIYVTALLPFILGVPLGILDTKQLALSYGDKNVFLFLGGFILALSLEKWHVHKQVAKIIIHIVGYSKPRILLGFLLSTAILSMWISNTATALMMLPMAMAVLTSLPKKDQDGKFALFLMLSIAYAASIGGMGTLVGSPPNIQMAGILDKSFGVQVDFFDWMKIGVPIAVIMIAIVYAVFYFSMGAERKESPEDFKLEKKPWTKNQIRVSLIFTFVVVLWIFKKSIIEFTGFPYGDEGAAILGSLLLFLIPGEDKTSLLNWKDTEKLPWGILLLFGGGLALASALEVNGVIDYLTSFFDTFKSWDYFFLLTVLIAVAIFGTEFMSNLALVTVFIPIIGAFAQESQYDIIQLCVPVTLAASCAFMLPIGTPPNAIVFSSGKITIAQMARIGVVFNILALILISTMAYYFL